MKLLKISLVSLFFIATITCSEDEEIDYPLIITGEVTDIDSTGATFHARIMNSGRQDITEYGFIWGTNFKLEQNNSLITFKKNPEKAIISKRVDYDILPGVNYVHAYIVNEQVASYGNIISFESRGSLPPEITNFYPKKGSDGSRITIAGDNFSNSKYKNTVKFGDIEATPLEASQKELTVVLPDNISVSGMYNITVTTAGQSAVSEELFFLEGCLIESFEPTEGTLGDTITLKGKNFSTVAEDNLVKIGAFNSEVVSSTDSTVICIVPENLRLAPVAVFITVSGKQNQATENFSLKTPVIESFTPIKGNWGDTITIKGKYFSPVIQYNQVRFRTETSEVISSSNTKITCIVPDNITNPSVTIYITIAGRQGRAEEKFSILPPSIAYLSANSGFIGETILIYGDNFHPYPDRNKVLFGKYTAPVISASKQELEIELPRVSFKHRIGKFEVTVAEQTATSPGEFTFLDEWLDGKPGNFTYQGYTYKTTIIAGKEWMAENLRATLYSDGTPIESGIWDYNDDPANSENYGKLYNWETAMNGAPSSNDNPSGVQGICPDGWHLPSDSEWEEMINYLVNEYGLTNYYDDPEGVGNVLKTARQIGHPWGGEHDTDVHPRWDYHGSHFGTDIFNFSSLPGGYRSSGGDYMNLGSYVFWWTSTERSNIDMASRWDLRLFRGSVNRYYYYKGGGFSVRCVRVVE